MEDTRKEAKDLICDIIAAAGGKIDGNLRLYKVFYRAHLNYWESEAGVLTDHPIVKMNEGPGIDKGEDILEELKRDGIIRISDKPTGPYMEYVFELAGNRELPKDGGRFKAIQEALDWVRGKTTTALSRESKKIAWNRAKNLGDEMDIYFDTLSQEEYKKIQETSRAVGEIIDAAFS